ncbi:hypothetical protein G7Y89_g712 [Cudoniella acicularis]|uniref:Tyrosinase copper-binding domain-containing protein n=1 Tax=Cudoniella acicularis TaxID=354080 RepID=A0A8H4WA62_9HELO|nr:hypothetical protein G7Y89_g712 [Cudoniella acicularis]
MKSNNHPTKGVDREAQPCVVREYQSHPECWDKTGVYLAHDICSARQGPLAVNSFQKLYEFTSWSLYIQALNAMQQTPEDNMMSYFQIAGIHGRPYYAWDGYEQDPSAPLIGYCTHNSVLFPTWHRPYLALFEKILVGHVQTIAKQYRSIQYQTAADNFRIPFWDWASTPTMPDTVITPTIRVNTPSGTKNVTNPLYQYKFQKFPLNDTWFPTDADAQLSRWPTTVRHPDENGTSNEAAANSDLAAKTLMQDVYAVFATVTDYDTMATGSMEGTSFEYVHNVVHYSVGCCGERFVGGHMSSVAYSAFDPIFWLHHANVDRLFAMWEAINPTQFLVPSTDFSGTFTIRQQTNDTVSTFLTPFTTSDGKTPYDSTSSRTTKAFGYSYADIPDLLLTPDQLVKNVTALVNTKYNPGGIFTPKAKKPVNGSRGASKRDRQPQVRDWSVAIQAMNTALGENYAVTITAGIAGKVGEMLVIPPPDAENSTSPITTNHVLSLSDVVMSANVDTQNVTAVVSYLKSNLAWSVTKFDGTPIPNEQVKGLNVRVDDTIVTLPASIEEFPKYGTRTPHTEITTGKAGGA